MEKDPLGSIFLATEMLIGPPIALLRNFLAVAANLSGVLGGLYSNVPYHSGPSARKIKLKQAHQRS
jgi:hypothetical protein